MLNRRKFQFYWKKSHQRYCDVIAQKHMSFVMSAPIKESHGLQKTASPRTHSSKRSLNDTNIVVFKRFVVHSFVTKMLNFSILLFFFKLQFDFGYETWGMNPSLVVEMLQKTIRNRKLQNHKKRTTKRTNDEILAELKTPTKSSTT